MTKTDEDRQPSTTQLAVCGKAPWQPAHRDKIQNPIVPGRAMLSYAANRFFRASASAESWCGVEDKTYRGGIRVHVARPATAHIEQTTEVRSHVAKLWDLLKVELPPKVHSVVTKKASPTEKPEIHAELSE